MRIGTVAGVGLLLLCIAGPAASAAPEVYLIGGLSLSNLGGDADQFGEVTAAAIENEVGGSWIASKKSRAGVDLGVGASFAFTDVVGGAVELRYATRGAKWDFTEVSGSDLRLTGTMKLDYVEIPALLQLTAPASGSVQPVFVIGPVLGFKTSSDFEAKASGQTSSAALEGMKGATFGGIIGAGIKARVTPRGSFLLNARYQRGFTNLVDDPTFSLKSSGFSFMTGWSIRL
jgi:outer membrane protein with beta-barrel domain